MAVGRRQGPRGQGSERRRFTFDQYQAETFDRVAEVFAQPLPPDVRQRLAIIVAAPRISVDDAVLDVGTGTGALIPYVLAHQPRRVMACDLSAAMLRYAQERFGQTVELRQEDVIDLPPALGPFTVVFCNAVFGNFPDQAAVLKTLRRLLADGGRLVISHPMGRAFVRRLRRHNPKLVPHLLPVGRRLESLLAHAGFRLVSLRDEPLLYLVLAQAA